MNAERGAAGPFLSTDHLPLAPDGSVLAGAWLRVDGLSFIGSDTALFHLILPATGDEVNSYNARGNRLVVADSRGHIFIARATLDLLHRLDDAGFTPSDLTCYFAHGETLVEPNPRLITAADITALDAARAPGVNAA